MKIDKPIFKGNREHSIYSPSGSSRWIKCPASIKMCQLVEEPKEDGAEPERNFFAEEGTAAHELGEYCLTNEVTAISQLYKVFNLFTVDKEMARQTQKYIDYVLGQVAWDSNLWVECKVPINHIEETMFGTADAVVFSDDYLEIIDLKYGKGVVVEATDNSQLMLYAIGVLAYLRQRGIQYHNEFEVKLTIVQPRAPHDAGPIRSDIKTIKELKEFQNIVKNAVSETKENEPPFGPGADTCMWCAAAPVCRAYTDYNLDVAKLEFGEFKLHKIELMSDVDIRTLLDHRKSIENWLKHMHDYVLSQLKQGKKVLGYKLVYGKSNRAWSNPDDLLKVLVDAGVSSIRLYNRKFLSPAQMENELDDKEYEIAKDYVFKPTGKLTLAKESDARRAIEPVTEAKDEWAE